MHRYRDVSADAGARLAAAFPEIVQGFEALGFVQVGLVALDDVDHATVVYAEPDQSWYVAHAHEPATVLRSPEADALADISSSFGDEPSIRIRSVLEDGSLVETLRALSRKPHLLVPDGESIGQQQRRGHAPARGHSVRLVDSAEPAVLAAAHREHLADMCRRRGASPVEHADVPAYVRLSERALDRRIAVMRAAGRLAIGMPIGVALLGVTLLPLLALMKIRISGGLLLAGLGLVLTVLGVWLAQRLAPRLVALSPPDLVPPSTAWRLLRTAVRFGALGAVVLAVLVATAVVWLTEMPGHSYTGPVESTAETEAVARRLDAHVRALADIGPRHTGRPASLEAAAVYVEEQLAAQGWAVERQGFEADGVQVRNLVVEVPGHSRELVVVGAHYDSVPGSPGADDNASGVAALIELARRFRGRTPGRTIRFVAFTNEECPHCMTDTMGSVVYARSLAARDEQVVAMLSLETLGYYTEAPGSQHYPPPFHLLYPDRGDFVAFVGDLASHRLVRDVTGSFRRVARVASEGGAVPAGVEGAGWSDHWAFWEHGWRAVMVTDTAFLRNPHYHRPSDRPEHLDLDRLAWVVLGLEAVVSDLCARPSGSAWAWGWAVAAFTTLLVVWHIWELVAIGREGFRDIDRA